MGGSSGTEASDPVVVTGAAGLLGARLVVRFARAGVPVCAVVRNEGDRDAVCGMHAGISAITWDELMGGECRGDSMRPRAFVHLAWNGVGAAEKDLVDLQVGNIGMAIAALECAGALGAKRFVMPGSAMELAGGAKGPFPPVPPNAYAAAKQSCRSFGAVLAARFGFSFVYAYISSVYAPERNDGNVIWYTASKLLAGQRPALSSMEQQWDFIHANDAAEALFLLAMKPGVVGEYEVGSGNPRPLSDYLFCLRDLIDPALPLGIGEAPASRHTSSIAPNIDRLVADTGFAPKVPFAAGMEELVHALRETR